MTIGAFKKTILEYYAGSGRVFPWRTKLKPWGILVSEFMLQQTQTARVVPYWEKWMKLWPSPAKLAAASLEDVLKEWSGLGYNSRAKRLWECSRAIDEQHRGKVPKSPEKLLTLPGIGPYTAGAVACFAWNYPALFIETNIRSVFLHFFFHGKEGIMDCDIMPLLEKSLDRDNPRLWYWALMDYGAELKKVTVNPNRKSAHYGRQSPFKGSLREIRGAIVKKLAGQGKQDGKTLLTMLENDLETMKTDDFYRALDSLQKDMLVAEEKGTYRIGG